MQGTAHLLGRAIPVSNGLQSKRRDYMQEEQRIRQANRNPTGMNNTSRDDHNNLSYWEVYALEFPVEQSLCSVKYCMWYFLMVKMLQDAGTQDYSSPPPHPKRTKALFSPWKVF